MNIQAIEQFCFKIPLKIFESINLSIRQFMLYSKFVLTKPPTIDIKMHVSANFVSSLNRWLLLLSRKNKTKSENNYPKHKSLLNCLW